MVFFLNERCHEWETYSHFSIFRAKIELIMRKKVIFAAIGVGLVLIGVFFLSRLQAKNKEKIVTAKVKRTTLKKVISASGKVKSEKEIGLKFQTSGKLAWVGVKEGDSVKQWQAIASLDKKELQKKLEKEVNDYMNERWNFEEDRETYHVTTDDLDKYTLSNTVRRILEKAQFDLNNTVLDVEIAHETQELATLVSPISGIVTHIDIPVAGVNITPATAVFTVADPNQVVFEANVDEVDIGQIKAGQGAILTLDAYPEEEIETKVEKISFTATTTRGGGTAFPVKFTLPENQNLKFKLGMNGDVEIILQEKESVLVVLSEAIIKRGEKYYVFVVKNGVAKKQEIKVGLETETETEILGGVSEGEEIITKNLSEIKEGQGVK